LAFNLLRHFQKPEVIKEEGVKASTNEITSSQSPYFKDSYFRPYNADLLYRKKGNYDIYDDMREDDAIKSILMTKKYLMLGSGWTIDIKDEEDTQQIEIKEFIEKALEQDIDIDFNKSMLEMLTAMDYGVSFSEIVWKLEDGKYKIKYIKTRSPHAWLIHQDVQGNITKLEQRAQEGSIIIDDLTNMVVFPYQMEFDNWYGKSDLKSAYRAWWSKDFIIKAWNIYLDRFGMPLAIGKFDAGVTSAEDQTKLQTIMDRIQTKTSITIPKDLEIEFLEATRAGEAGYEAAMNNYNLQIARSMLMPDLLGMAGDKTSGGSYSLGQTQYDMFLKTLEWTRHELQRYIQRKIIDPLVKYNFATEDIPQFKFKAMSETVKVESLKTWIELQKTGKYKPSAEEINWARRILGAPEGDVEYNAPISPILPGQGNNGEEDEKDTSKGKGEAGNDENDDDMEEEDTKKMSVGQLRAPIMAEKKQDFAKVNEDQLNTIELYSRQASATIATMQEVLLETIKKGRWIENKKLDKVANLELKYTDRLRVDIQSGMREMFNMGKRDAKFELKQPEKYAMDDSEEIYDQVVKNAPMLAATSISDEIVKKVKITLSNGITQGLAQGEIIKQIKQIFEPYLYSIDGALLETTIRTNFATAYNQSKLAYFAPAVNNGDIYGYQYSAIMDDRTTDICYSLNGKIFRADAVSDIEPPLHYNALTPDTLITTQKGLRPISEIKIGDCVYTHKKRVQRVYDVMTDNKSVDIYEIETDQGLLKVTGDHPVLTQRGWINVEELSINDELYSIAKNRKIHNKEDKRTCPVCGKEFIAKNNNQLYCSRICVNHGKKKTRFCKTCGKEIPSKGKKKNKVYCSKVCAHLGLRKLVGYTCKACGKKMIGAWHAPISKDRKFCSQKCYFSYKGETSIEKIVREFLELNNIKHECQYSLGKYFADFYLPDYNLIIEADGNYWHDKKERWDKRAKKEQFIEDKGIRLIRLKQDNIKSGQFIKELNNAISSKN
jgi:SPP1 gp7 family putative phage head morphogenesis protein